MSATDLRVALRTAGYHGIEDLDHDAGEQLGRDEALDPTGGDVEVGVDAVAGRIVCVEQDRAHAASFADPRQRGATSRATRLAVTRARQV